MKIVDTCGGDEKPFTFADTKPGDVFTSGRWTYLRIADRWQHCKEEDRELLAVAIRGPEGAMTPYNINRFGRGEEAVTLLPNATLVLEPEGTS